MNHKEVMIHYFSLVVIVINQVCLVEQRGTKKVLAMKYVNKEACAKQGGILTTVFERFR